MSNKKQRWKIPVTWSAWGIMEIEAVSQEEAIKIAKGDAPLPTESEYINNSCEIDYEALDSYQSTPIE